MSHAHTTSSSSSNKNSAHTVTAMIKKFSKSIGAFRSSRLKKNGRKEVLLNNYLALKVKNTKKKILEKEQKVEVIFKLVLFHYLLAVYGIQRLVNEKSQSTTYWYPTWNLKINIVIN